MKLNWLPYELVSDASINSRGIKGIYKLGTQGNGVVYFGESENIGKRLSRHAQEWSVSNLVASFVELPNAMKYQLREMEVDQIGRYFMEHKHPPKYQYRKLSQ